MVLFVFYGTRWTVSFFMQKYLYKTIIFSKFVKLKISNNK